MNQRPTASLEKAGSIKNVAQRIIGLPTLPTVVSKVMELVDHPRSTARSIARLISADQSLTARILKLANSSFYGLSRQISTIDKAIIVIGLNTLKDTLLSISVLDTFDSSHNNPNFKLNKFWEHSISVGIATRVLAIKFHPNLSSDGYTSGLLHDVGKVIMNKYLKQDFDKIMFHVFEEDLELMEAERIVLGTHHGRIGSWLAERWNMPETIADAIEFHNIPHLAEQNKELVYLVYFADYLIRIMKIGDSGNKNNPGMIDEIKSGLISIGIDPTPELIEALSLELRVELEKSSSFASLML